MNRTPIVRLALGGLLWSAAQLAASQQALEIIPLRHRTVEQVLPTLQPLLEPGATLSGQRGQLFLRASPGNAAEIRRALEAIDRPSRRLQISVRFDEALASQQQQRGVSGVVSPGGSRVVVTAQDSASASTERIDQRLQVLEGGRAFIFTGQSTPMRTEGSTVIRESASGFEVTPRLVGNQVLLDVAQQREVAGHREIQGQRLVTTVSGRIGEWIELGGTASAGTSIGAGSSTSRRVWVKVEESK